MSIANEKRIGLEGDVLIYSVSGPTITWHLSESTTLTGLQDFYDTDVEPDSSARFDNRGDYYDGTIYWLKGFASDVGLTMGIELENNGGDSLFVVNGSSITIVCKKTCCDTNGCGWDTGTPRACTCTGGCGCQSCSCHGSETSHTNIATYFD